LDFGKDPAWSPQGRWIAFARGNALQEEVWIVEPSGENLRKVTDGGFPSWSTDGKTLFFHSRIQKKILAVKPEEKESPVAEVCEMPWCMYPAVSAEGTKICYMSNGALYILDSKTQKVTSELAMPRGGEAFFRWSPDGKQVGIGIFNPLLNQDYDDGLWILNVKTRVYKKIGFGPFTMPAWSPDGSKIAADYRGRNRVEVWVIETKNIQGAK
jgi:Tol biopolymer transport system component